MSDQSLIAIVKELYGAMASMDLETYASHIHPDFRVVESDSLPYSGVFHGLDGFQQLVEKVFGMFSEFEASPSAYSEGDGHVMVWVEMKMTGRQTGKTIHTRLIEVFRFEGDKLIEICPFYYDTDLIKSAL